MNSHDNDGTNENDFGAGDDVTLAAGGDVVAQIRAHAAKVRSGEAVPDEDLQIWTSDAQPPAEDSLAADADMIDVREPGKLLPDDQTVPLESTRAELAQAIADAKAAALLTDDDFTEPPQTVPLTQRPAITDPEIDHPASDPAPIEKPVVDLRRAAPNATAGGSLIDGQATPQVSTSFWETDQPFRASGIDAPRRLRGSGGIPMMVWIALVLVVIVVASVGIAVAIATTGPLT